MDVHSENALADQGLDTRLIQDDLGPCNIQHTIIYTATHPARFEGSLMVLFLVDTHAMTAQHDCKTFITFFSWPV